VLAVFVSYYHSKIPQMASWVLNKEFCFLKLKLKFIQQEFIVYSQRFTYFAKVRSKLHIQRTRFSTVLGTYAVMQFLQQVCVNV